MVASSPPERSRTARSRSPRSSPGHRSGRHRPLVLVRRQEMTFPSILGRLVAVACTSFAMATASAQDIKLGYNGDLSASPSAQSGQAAVLGMQAAIDDLNGTGGVLGRKLTLIVRDDVSQPPKSIQNMSALIDNEKVAVIFGPTNSGNAMAWKHIPTQKKIPVIGNVS